MAINQQRVSLCMIVRDEEQNLEACLGPIAHLFDEIIITDTGSRDGTLDIARRFTPHVHHFPWCDDFSAARNESLRHATGDWIFWLDADDRICPSQIAQLRELFAQLDDRPRVYMLNTVLLPSQMGEEPRFVSHPRLFRRHSGLQWSGRVHEQLMPNFDEPRYERLFSKIEIEHVGYHDRGVVERKSRRKLRLLRMDYAVDPSNPSTLFHLGMSLVHAGNYPEASRHFLQLLNMAPADSLRWVYDALIDLSLLTGNTAEAARFAQRALVQFPDDEYLLYALAKTHFINRDYQNAIGLLELAIAAPNRELLFPVTGNVKTKLAPLMLGAAYRMLGDGEKAEAALQGVLNADPDDCEAAFNIGLVYLDQGRGTDLIEHMQRLLARPRGASNAKLLAALCHLRRGNVNVACQLIDNVIANDPNQVRARMLRVECLSRSRAPLEEQIRAIQDVLRLEPGVFEARAWLQRLHQQQSASRRAAMPDWSSTDTVLAAEMPA